LFQTYRLNVADQQVSRRHPARAPSGRSLLSIITNPFHLRELHNPFFSIVRIESWQFFGCIRWYVNCTILDKYGSFAMSLKKQYLKKKAGL